VKSSRGMSPTEVWLLAIIISEDVHLSGLWSLTPLEYEVLLRDIALASGKRNAV
jgi:hypothetical protein